jgi:predicted TIM-barrel fold metal-dependent hydrolase
MTRRCIVLARIENTALRYTGRLERYDGVNYRPIMEAAPEAKALIWLNNGTKDDVVNAEKFASKEGYTVILLTAKHPDPLNVARNRIMQNC